METIALKIASYDFTNKEGKAIRTEKYIVSLGDFGFKEINTDYAIKNNLVVPLLSKVKVIIEIKDNKIAIKSIVK